MTSLKAVLCAAVAMCATPGYAADVIRYTIETEGGGTYFTGGRTPDRTTFVSNLQFVFSVPTSGNYTFTTGPNSQSVGFPATYYAGPGYFGGGGGATVDGSSLTFTQGQGWYMLPGLRVNIAACLTGSAGGAFPIGTLSIVNGCGSVTYTDQGDGFVRNYTGVVSRITGVVGTGDPGLSSVTPGVPEPATWGMMLLGFGMVAGAARYRRRSANVRFA